jgi:hypothetical protein
MKIRIKGNSLRYRLTRSEVERLAATGCVEERINFGEATLVYSLRTTSQLRLLASFKDNRITVYLPASMSNEWASTGKVGFNERVPLGAETLVLLVEKDFTCLDNIEEDQSDNYPNPLLQRSE